MSILCTSVPVYAGLETLCCTEGKGYTDRVEIWLQSVQPQKSSPPVPEDIESPCCSHSRNEDVESVVFSPVLLSRNPSIASQWSRISRKPLRIPSKHGLKHGHTREIVIEPENFLTQRAGAEFLPARRPSQIGNGTKRLMLEG